MNTLLERTGKNQRVLEQILNDSMSNAEITSHVLKLSARTGMPIKCFNILNNWAIRTYGKNS